MPPSTRRRVQQAELHTPRPEDDDTDSELNLGSVGHAHALRLQQQQRHHDEEEGLEGELIEGEEDDIDDEEAFASPGGAHTPLPNLDPPPSYLREISTLASWTVSSSKPGCSIPQLRHPSTSLFWQSDGPQPHYLNIHFFKLVRIVGLRLYLDFEQDESYTPTRIIFLAGSGMNDLQEWGEMRLESPRGWVWADFSGVGDVDADSDDTEDEADGDGDSRMIDAGPARLALADASSDSENNNPQRFITQDETQTPQQQETVQHQHIYATPTDMRHNNLALTTPSLPRPSPRLPFAALPQSAHNTAPRPRSRQRTPRLPVLRAHLVQIKILENHQNGKDTHLRGLQIFARNDEKDVAREPFRATMQGMHVRGSSGLGGKQSMPSIGGRKERRAERLELGGFDEASIR